MQSSTRSNLIIASCYAGILAVGMAVGPKFGKENQRVNAGRTLDIFGGEPGKVAQVLNIIKENYVDQVKVDTLQYLAINQILSHLDPHSSYLPPVKARNQSQVLEGNYTGIGIEYLIVSDTMLVTAVKNGPAASAGIGPGDKVLKIGDRRVVGSGIKSEEIVSLIKGRAGTSVNLLVRKRGTGKDQPVSVKRARITLNSLDAAYMIAPSVGYIKISKFAARTHEDFVSALDGLQRGDMKGLILDLRQNGGGYLSAATALADEFLPDKQLIVYTQGSHEPRTDYFATAGGKFEKGKLILLIDETTASASEVLAGAIQDLGRGTVIGRRSFGKGLVQEQFNFGDGSALNLTVSRYFTPLGRSIQRPYKMSTEDYYAEASKRLEKDESLSEVKDSLNKHKEHFKTSSGRILYGGGGISPDIYIPVDSSAFNAFFYALRSKGILTDFLFNRLVQNYHPASLQQLDEFSLSDRQYKQLVENARSQGVKIPAKTISVARKAVVNELKAALARFYFGDAAYYNVLNSGDPAVLRSIQEIISN